MLGSIIIYLIIEVKENQNFVFSQTSNGIKIFVPKSTKIFQFNSWKIDGIILLVWMFDSINHRVLKIISQY